MASHHSSDDEGYGIDPSVPFQGVIVCCTSIPPDQRTDIAQKVAELGGVHKYDLTPDVTHLVVGDYDTPKYRHVARERADIKAMDAAWINAVNELWKNDDEIDLVALEKRYQLKALETSGTEPSLQEDTLPAARGSLLICLTGFGDERDKIAEMITQNGGQYSGDLTRRCSHLIVNKPEGKKFTAAKAWGLHTVTLDWLVQSVERGMILEESKFDPLLPPEEQGVGAWVKKDLKRSSLGKRARSAVVGGGRDEGVRKLRKTASMKLSSQRNDLWGDILGRSASREYSFAHENPPGAPGAPAAAPTPASQVPTQPGYSLAQEEQGVFANCVFVVHGFPQQRAAILEQTVATLGGSIASSLQSPAMLSQPTDPEHYRFLIVPQTSQPDTHPEVPNEHIHVITEFYIENCLHNKRFFNPNEQVLGRPFPLFPIPAFSSLTVCSAAFTGIELNQVARAVAQLGGKYEESFRRSTNVLVCKSLMAMRKEKLKCALDWGVPVVSADWLWECISSGSLVPIQDFVYPELRKRRVKRRDPRDPFVNDEDDAETEQQPRKAPETKPVAKPAVDTSAFDKDVPGRNRAKQTLESITSADFITARTHPAETAMALELPDTLQPKQQSVPPPEPTKQPPQPSETAKAAKEASADEIEKQRQLAAAAELRQGLTSALSDLTGSEAATRDQPDARVLRRRRQKILGRAISNASNASSAASIDGAAYPPRALQEDEDEEERGRRSPPATQLEYRDPEAMETKAMLMSRMTGASAEGVSSEGLGRTRSSRRR
ncbi:uncharacterized protein TRIREDRAFT_120897 [Trichoderma reesei QM6a]|uniref:BRCT domain-containing protein n=2 Tax=Hypocrea jecorina TaxID=51453 RepID=G0RF98_HYPJQ|nr:uncharacterized protein TRIREDRAFT_120897 [Trichoderma reesei QM6a]EGR50315.1 hypothetical protein TRIREDRAFT_120897 [Trichoderma reesei QM6a]ETS03663.1 hypothetical protein M419DRAFT_136365 [Trichoderma reesei RUT C-30]